MSAAYALMGWRAFAVVKGRAVDSGDLLRSVLILPANVERFVRKAPEIGADAVCLDLEDSVPAAEKEAARSHAAQALITLPKTGYLLFVRVNGQGTGFLEDDLIAVVRPGLDGVILSKTESPDHVRRADHYLTVLERQRGLPAGTVRLIALVESALGIARAFEICGASPRLSAALFGAEDFATDMGVERTGEGREVLWARSLMAVACRAGGIAAIDTPATAYADETALEADMLLGRSLGYCGKLCIHPTQVSVANRVFTPSPAQLEAARQLVETFEREALAKGRASIAIGGKMVDTPMYERAKRLLRSVQPLD